MNMESMQGDELQELKVLIDIAQDEFAVAESNTEEEAIAFMQRRELVSEYNRVFAATYNLWPAYQGLDELYDTEDGESVTEEESEEDIERHELLDLLTEANRLNLMDIRSSAIYTDDSYPVPLKIDVVNMEAVPVQFVSVEYQTLFDPNETYKVDYEGLVLTGLFYVPAESLGQEPQVDENGENVAYIVSGRCPLEYTEVVRACGQFN